MFLHSALEQLKVVEFRRKRKKIKDILLGVLVLIFRFPTMKAQPIRILRDQPKIYRAGMRLAASWE